jgi:hypothetical protein
MSDLSQSLLLSTPEPANGLQRQINAGESGIPSVVTLDRLLIPKPASTVIFPVRTAITQYGLNMGDLLIVDREANPSDNQLVIISTNDDLIVSRFSQSFSNTPPNLSDDTENGSITLPIWGVVTYIIQKQ